jgi:DNA-binding LacI/PurR family transcriptional regulator/signal transduction histidine kinase
MQYSIDLQKKRKKLTIGYLDDNDSNENYTRILMGVNEAARRYDVNLIRFSYFTSYHYLKYANQAEMLFNLIEQYDLDGLIFLGWTEVAGDYESFRRHLGSLPLLSIGKSYDDIACVYFPGNDYLREVLIHLIKMHGCREIAYIGPENPDSRNDVYIEVMKEHEIFKPELFVNHNDLCGISSRDRMKRAVEILLDERKASIDAIISPGNHETDYLMRELQIRDIKVPEDIAVISYDDADKGKFSVPQRTTVVFPWWTLGFAGCEKMVELLTKGHIPQNTLVPGRIIYRDSCGCKSSTVLKASVGRGKVSNKTLTVLNEDDKKDIIHSLNGEFTEVDINFEKLLEAFLADYKIKSYSFFITELSMQLRNAARNFQHTNIEEVVVAFRKRIYPYLASSKEDILWTGNMFSKSQVLLSEKVFNMYGRAGLTEKHMTYKLQEASQDIIKDFSKESLMCSIQEGLNKLGIPSCYIFLFDDFIDNENADKHIFNRCNAVFKYFQGDWIRRESNETGNAKNMLEDLFSAKDETCTLFTHYLHVTDEIIGFVMFEAGPIDEGLYQALAGHISTTLKGIALIDKLGISYEQLITEAYREGMTDIVTSILHNIGNVFNSVTSSIHITKRVVKSSPIKDLLKANALLEKNIQSIDSYILNDEKGKKLLQFYLMLGRPFKEYKAQLLCHLERMNNKISWMNDIIAAQQSYAGVSSMVEEMDLSNIIEDVLKVNSASLDKYNIEIIRNYKSFPKAYIQPTKLFHILISLINYSKEAMMGVTLEERKIIIKLYENNKGKFIQVTNSWDSIPDEKLNNIFNSEHSYGGNYRLSLYSCLNYMSEMSGEIWAERDNMGKGTTFILHFHS